MSDIIFIHIVGTPVEIKAIHISPSIAFSYFTSYMVEMGYTSKSIFVSQNEEYNELVNLKTKTDIDIKEIILKEKPKIIAFSPVTPTYNKAVEIVKLVKEVSPETITCIGNIHATAFPQQALKDGFDYVFLRDGFVTFPGFVKKVMNGRRNLDKIIFSEKTIDSLDSIPFIIFEDLTPTGHGVPFGHTFTTFYCPFNCKFCGNSNFIGTKWKKLEPRSPRRIFEDIKYQNEIWGFTVFGFCDPTLLPNKMAFQRLTEINKLTDKLDFDLRFFLNCRLDMLAKLVKEDPKLVDLALRKADVFFVGIEVMDNAILNSYNKAITTDDTIIGIEALQKRDKALIMSFIIGGPNDTYETIENMVSFIKKIEHQSFSIISISIFTPYPFTNYYREFEEKNLLITKNWNFYDERHLVFKHPVFKPGEVEKIREEIINSCNNNIYLRANIRMRGNNS